MKYLQKFLDLVWPIHGYEHKKFLPMSVMMLLTIFVYSILRGAKDAILIPSLGAEIISTVKLWGVLPGAVCFFLLYSKLSNIIDRSKLYYVMVQIFAIFFLIYGLLLYPNTEYLHPNLSRYANYETHPILYYFRYIFKMLDNWTHTLFFIFSELWGSVMLNFMFWQFANHITTIDEAKRFYSIFGLIGQYGQYFAGLMIAYIAYYGKSISGSWGGTLNIVIVSVVIATILLSLIYWWMQKNVLSDIKLYNPDKVNDRSKRKNIKLSLKESIKYICKSKYLGLIAILVLCYGFSINLVEGVWKKQLQLQYPDPNDYFAFMGYSQQWAAVVTMVGMIIGSNVIRKLGWRAGALLTPLMILITGAIFFVLSIFKDEFTMTFAAAVGSTSLTMLVYTGAMQNILSKAIKYAAFDATKEMSYIPLDDELKMKGKAAVDMVGTRFGKSIGAVVQWSLLTFIADSNLQTLTAKIFSTFVFVIAIWLFGVFSLSKEFEKASNEYNSSN